MPSAALGRTLALTTRVSLPRLAPAAAGSSPLFRFMSSWGESESSSATRHRNNAPTTTSAQSSDSQGKRPKKVHINFNNDPSLGDDADNNTAKGKIAKSTKKGKDDGNDNGFFVKSQDNPNLYRIFFRSPDKLASLEEAQVFINHIRSNYGPLTQYQFARCPETKRYFGYGFLTFKQEDSLEKALKDGYIRVGMKDFELKRTGFISFRRNVKHKNTGFSGFYDLEELRANKAKAEEEAKEAEATAKTFSQLVEEGSRSSSNTTIEGGLEETTFVSAFKPSTTETTSTTSATVEATVGTPTKPKETSPSSSGPKVSKDSAYENKSTTSKPFFKPLQNRGPAQLWKTIPADIQRAEAEESSKGPSESEADVVIPPV